MRSTKWRASDVGWVGDVGSAIGGFFSSVWDKVKGGVQAAVNALGAAVFAILSAIAGVWGGIVSAADSALTWAENAAAILANTVQAVWTKYLPDLYKGLKDAGLALYHFSVKVAGWIDAAYKYVDHLVTRAVEAVWRDIKTYVVDPIIGDIRNVWDTLTALWNTVHGWIENPLSLIDLLFVPLLNYVAALSDQVIEAVVEWAFRIFARGLSRIVSVGEKILSDLF